MLLSMLDCTQQSALGHKTFGIETRLCVGLDNVHGSCAIASTTWNHFLTVPTPKLALAGQRCVYALTFGGGGAALTWWWYGGGEG